jgi:hypothetical protein
VSLTFEEKASRFSGMARVKLSLHPKISDFRGREDIKGRRVNWMLELSHGSGVLFRDAGSVHAV